MYTKVRLVFKLQKLIFTAVAMYTSVRLAFWGKKLDYFKVGEHQFVGTCKLCKHLHVWSLLGEIHTSGQKCKPFGWLYNLCWYCLSCVMHSSRLLLQYWKGVYKATMGIRVSCREYKNNACCVELNIWMPDEDHMLLCCVRVFLIILLWLLRHGLY